MGSLLLTFIWVTGFAGVIYLRHDFFLLYTSSPRPSLQRRNQHIPRQHTLDSLTRYLAHVRRQSLGFMSLVSFALRIGFFGAFFFPEWIWEGYLNGWTWDMLL
jgi:hypothetical protein